MYSPDLANYQYSLPRALPDVYSVGWLERPHPFAMGTVAPTLLEKLKTLVLIQPARQMRGYSDCEICGAEEVVLSSVGSRRMLGAAEVWIPDARVKGRTYAAPNLIVHYIEVHRYLPPAAFLRALEIVDPASWNGTRECQRILDEQFNPERHNG